VIHCATPSPIGSRAHDRNRTSHPARLARRRCRSVQRHVPRSRGDALSRPARQSRGERRGDRAAERASRPARPLLLGGRAARRWRAARLLRNQARRAGHTDRARRRNRLAPGARALGARLCPRGGAGQPRLGLGQHRRAVDLGHHGAGQHRQLGADGTARHDPRGRRRIRPPAGRAGAHPAHPLSHRAARLMAASVSPARLARPLFVATILTGSVLLFLVQPMGARLALPRRGGAPAVWNSAMLVYQALLLGGYAYAHWLGRIAPRWQAAIHLTVLVVAALWLPIGLNAMELPADAQPALWVPWLLGLAIGPLFFAVAAQAPLLQRWFSIASEGQDPYALYAASNFGSFAGLIAYPLIVEPGLALWGQRWLWTGGYVLVALLVAGCALTLRRAPVEVVTEAAPDSPAPSGRRVAHWIVLALVPSGLMLATSAYITADIVAVPLLWVLPLGLYLLSFTIAFSARRGVANLLTRLAPIVILLFGGVLVTGNQGMPYLDAGLTLVLLFVVAVALHSAMYALRPAPDRLPGFYLAMSVGGVLGGVFAALIAPLVFDWTYEYPILILAAGALVPQNPLFRWAVNYGRESAQQRRIVVLATALVVVLLIVLALTFPGTASEAISPIQGLLFAALVTVGVR